MYEGWTREDLIERLEQIWNDREQLMNTLIQTANDAQDILAYLDTVLHPLISLENWNVYSELHDMVASLPSAQPEIVRCEECKHYKEWESEFTPNAVVTQCMADNFPIRKAIPDGWFCAGAERKRK